MCGSIHCIIPRKLIWVWLRVLGYPLAGVEWVSEKLNILSNVKLLD